MSAGVAEYLLEARFWPQLKQQQSLEYAGLVLVILGEAIRKLAMVSESRSACFTGSCCAAQLTPKASSAAQVQLTCGVANSS